MQTLAFWYIPKFQFKGYFSEIDIASGWQMLTPAEINELQIPLNNLPRKPKTKVSPVSPASPVTNPKQETVNSAPYSFAGATNENASQLQNTQNSSVGFTAPFAWESIDYFKNDLWSEEIVQKFKKEAPIIAENLFADKNLKLSCEDFCLEVIMTFALKNKLQFNFKTQSKKFTLSFSKASNKEIELGMPKQEVFDRAGATDLEQSLDPIPLDEVEIGDFTFTMNKGDETLPVADHAQFITEAGIVDELFFKKYPQLNNGIVAAIGERYAIFTQGNFRGGKPEPIEQGLINITQGSLTRFYRNNETVAGWVAANRVVARRLKKGGFGKNVNDK